MIFSAVDLVQWRHHLHAHPELAFLETATADFVAAKLAGFGIEVHRGLAGTGVVGLLRKGEGPTIGLRADMDALAMAERTGLPHASKHQGRMHACGHDGHTAMLLGAAKALAEKPNFQGSVVFVFQPAEEIEGGGRVMVEEGLFEKFPMDSIYALHNWPGLAAGQFMVRPGPMMAALDTFELTIEGKGTHAGMPHLGVDPMVVAAQLIGAWQTIVSRNVSPLDAAVVSVTEVKAGDTWNVIPDQVFLRGTVRTLKEEVRDRVEARMSELAQGICQAFATKPALTYQRRYPPTVNSATEAGIAEAVAVDLVGRENVLTHLDPSMGAEDFSHMLEKCPGAYVWIGNGPAENGKNLHSPTYDFNDDILELGVRYWVGVVEKALGVA